MSEPQYVCVLCHPPRHFVVPSLRTDHVRREHLGQEAPRP